MLKISEFSLYHRVQILYMIRLARSNLKNSSMETMKKIDSKGLLAIITLHYPTLKVANIDDLSTGCDNWIFCVTFTKNNSELNHKVIIRVPRKLTQPDCPKMHFPDFQAYILDILGQNSIPCPKLLHISSNYLIESFLPERDLSKVEIKDQDQLKQIYSSMGLYVKKLHSIECCQQFGYIVKMDTNLQKLIGKYENWLTMFENEFPDNLKGCLSNNTIDEDMYETLYQLYSDLKPYLSSYSEPKLLHSDICANNTRVVYNWEQNKYEFSGLIDFADCMCGDPMFDLGELLLSSLGDYSIIEWFECGYGVLSAQHKSLIRFYAIHYNIWLLNSSALSEDTDKWLQTLQKLTKL